MTDDRPFEIRRRHIRLAGYASENEIRNSAAI
jgi:hypothetical protein